MHSLVIDTPSSDLQDLQLSDVIRNHLANLTLMITSRYRGLPFLTWPFGVRDRASGSVVITRVE